eukprot:COSAG06_NODE_664_length_13285_cov_14.962853_18_plen_295_part_00
MPSTLSTASCQGPSACAATVSHPRAQLQALDPVPGLPRMVPKAYLAEVCGQRRRLWVRSNLRLCQALVIPCATRSQLRHVVRAEVQRDRLGQTTAPNRPGGRQPELILRTKESTRCEHSRPAACMITHARGRSCLARAQLAPARSASVFTAVSSGRGGSGRRTIFERTRAVSAAWLFRCACTTDRSVASCTPSTQERTTPPALRQNSAPAFDGDTRPTAVRAKGAAWRERAYRILGVGRAQVLCGDRREQSRDGHKQSEEEAHRGTARLLSERAHCVAASSSSGGVGGQTLPCP